MELLIVIVVIAILAAITIVAYRGIQDRAKASAASSAASQARKKVELYKAENDTYPATLAATGLSDSGSASYQYSVNTSTNTYCITATSSNVSYYINNSTVTSPTAGGCPGHGQGGVAAIINLALDPDAAGATTTNFNNAGTSASSTSSIASDKSQHGTTSLKRVITATATSGTGATAKIPSTRINATEPLSWTFFIYSTRAGTIIPIAEGTKVSDGTYVNCQTAAVAVSANAWTEVSTTCNPAVDMYVTVAGGFNLQVQVGDTVWLDSYMVTKGSTKYAYADGESANWTWNGTPNASTSTGPPL